MPGPGRYAIRFAINFIRHQLKGFIGEGNLELMLEELKTVDQNLILDRFEEWLKEPQSLPKLERVIRQAEKCFQHSQADQALKGGLALGQLSLEQNSDLLEALKGLEDALDDQALRAALVDAFQRDFPKLEMPVLENGAEEYLTCLNNSLLNHKDFLLKDIGMAVLKIEDTIKRMETSQADHYNETHSQHADVMKKLHDVEKQVSQPARTLRKPWQEQPLPRHFVPRPEISQELLAQLVGEPDSGIPALLLSTMHGLGGIGKTTLVANLVQDPRLKEHFPDGLLWITLGQKPDIFPRLSEWIQDLGDFDFHPITIEGASNHLRTLLLDKACLLVIDDAWQAEPVRACLVGGVRCRVLITTRDAGLASKLGAKLFSLEVMTETQALALFSARLGELGKHHVRATALAKELGYLPLAIELAAAQIESGRSWDELLDAFRIGLPDLRTLDLDEATFRNESLRLSFRLSLEVLSPEEQQAFAWLGVLQEDAAIGAKTAAILWGLNESAARHRLFRWRDKALLKPFGEERFTIHDLLLDEARLHLQEMLPIEHAHATLLQRYQMFCEPLSTNVDKKAWHTLPMDGYIHTHLTWHLLEAGQPEEIHRLLLEEDSDGKNGWYEACERSDQSAAYLNTLATAWRLAEMEHNIPLLIRYALCYASLVSLGSNIGSALLGMAVKHNLLSPDKTLLLVRQMSQPQQQSKAIQELASTLPINWLGEALDTADSIKPDEYRADALISLAPYMPAELLTKAINIAERIEQNDFRVDAVTALLLHLPEEKRQLALPNAFVTARSIRYKSVRTQALIRLAPYLPIDQREQALNEAFCAARGIKKGYIRAQVLVQLVPHLPINLLPAVFSELHHIQDEKSKAKVLASLAPRLPMNLLDEALNIAQSFQDLDNRALTLASISTLLQGDARDYTLNQALDVACSIKSKNDCSVVLAKVAHHMPYEKRHLLLEKALDIALGISKESDRSRTLVCIIPLLTNDLVAKALDAVYKIDGEIIRSQSIIELALYLPSYLLPEALKAARNIHDEEYSARALASLSPFLSDELLPKALDAARRIQDDFQRSITLANLSPYLPIPQRTCVLDEAFTAAQNILYLHLRAEALAKLAPKLTIDQRDRMLGDALDTARRVKKIPDRIKTLTRLLPFLPKPLDDEVVAEILKEARAIPKDFSRAKALVEVSLCLPTEKQLNFLSEALETIRNIKDEHLLSSALGKFASSLPPKLLPEALEMAQNIQNKESRSVALAYIAAQLNTRVIPALMTSVQGIQSEYSRASALAGLAQQLPLDLFANLLDMALSLQHEGSLVFVLTSLDRGLTAWAETNPDKAFSTWNRTIEIISRKPRTTLLLSIQALSSFTFALIHPNQRSQAATDIFLSIQDVCRWWP